jgi:hypothetical protein
MTEILQKLSSSRRKDLYLSEEEFKQVKCIILDGRLNVEEFWEWCIDRLMHVHGKCRILCVQIVDYVVVRMPRFRKIVFENNAVVVKECLGIDLEQGKEWNPKRIYVKPEEICKLLFELTLRILENWNDKFSGESLKFDFVFECLKSKLKLPFPNVIQREQERIQRINEENESKRKISELKFQKLSQDFERFFQEFTITLDEMDVCFEILIPSGELNLSEPSKEKAALVNVEANAHSQTNTTSNEEYESFSSSSESESNQNDLFGDDLDEFSDNEDENFEIPKNSVYTPKIPRLESIKVVINRNIGCDLKTSENQVIFDSLSEKKSVILKKFEPTIRDWDEVFKEIKRSECKEIAKRILNLVQRMELALRKCSELDI